MTYAIQWNNKTGWLATGAWMPRGDTPKIITVQNPMTRDTSSYRFDTPEHQLAWDVTAEAQRRAAYHGYDPASLGLETYVLGPTGDRFEGRCCSLFWDESPRTNYRLVLRHEQLGGIPSTQPDFWQDESNYRSDLYVGGIASEHRVLVNQLLDDMVRASDVGADAVKQVIEQAGHPYAHSRGFLDVYRGDVQ